MQYRRLIVLLLAVALVVAAALSDPVHGAVGSVLDEAKRIIRHHEILGLTLFVVLSAVPIAIFTNALRVSGTGILARFYGTKVADGFFHSFSGWVIYIAAFLLLFAFGWVLDRLRSLFSNDLDGGGTELDLNEMAQPSLVSVPKVAQSGGTD